MSLEFIGEFGHEERGVGDRVAHETWVVAHNRRNHLNLSHWTTVNNAEKKERVAKLKVVKGGVELLDARSKDCKTPSSIYEVSECLK